MKLFSLQEVFPHGGFGILSALVCLALKRLPRVVPVLSAVGLAAPSSEPLTSPPQPSGALSAAPTAPGPPAWASMYGVGGGGGMPVGAAGSSGVDALGLPPRAVAAWWVGGADPVALMLADEARLREQYTR
jgi:hypothetical protein